MKKACLISILVIILTIGAVNASDNTTSDDLIVNETSNNEINMNGLGNETWDMQVDENIEILPAQDQLIDIYNCPDDMKGKFSLLIDEVEQNLTENEYIVVLDATNLTFGQHKYDLKFLGDEKYLPTTKSGILTVSPIIFNFPSDIYLKGSDYLIDDDTKLGENLRCISITYLPHIKENVYLYMNGKEKILNLTDYNSTRFMPYNRYDSYEYNLITLDRSKQFYTYIEYFYFGKCTNLTAIYKDNSTNINKSGFVNVTYYLDCANTVIKGNDLEIDIPKSVSRYITVEIDGKSSKFYSSRITKDYTYIYFYAKTSSLNYGNHTIKINFIGNKNCSARSIIKTFTVVEEPISPKIIKLYYQDSKTYRFTIYGANGKPVEKNCYTLISIDGIFKTSKETDKKGRISYKIPSNLKPGTHILNTHTYECPDIYANVKLIVKHVITLKTVKLKKSAKKITLQATLKNDKAMKGKYVTFKFNGKIIGKAKTNSKGIAKVTIKSNILKKLKVGKKITYQATYGKDTIKKTGEILK